MSLDFMAILLAGGMLGALSACAGPPVDIDVEGPANRRFDIRAEMYGCRRAGDGDAMWCNLVSEDVDLCEMNEKRPVFRPPGVAARNDRRRRPFFASRTPGGRAAVHPGAKVGITGATRRALRSNRPEGPS